MRKRLKNLQTRRMKSANAFELKPFGKLSLNYLRNSNYFINIQHGAIRSSKTTASIVRWLKFIKTHHYDNFLMTGNTQTSLYRNVLRPMMSLLDSLGISYDWRKNEYIEIEGNTCWLMGFNHEGMAGRIPGVTLGGWYADEVNTYPKILVNLALDRLSEEDSQAFWTMNPDNPYHYLYKEYIENEKKKSIGDVKVWNYTIWDNPNLSKQYIERTIRRYPEGTPDYKRKILGIAAIAEGVIYSKFVEAHNTFDPLDPVYNNINYNKKVLSTDYGAGNVSVVGLFGILFNKEGNDYHLLDEYYYDATDPENNGVQLDDDDLYKNASEQLLDGSFLLNKWWTPHDAASLRATLKKKTYMSRAIPVDSYTPDVNNDIQEIQKLFANQKFKISKKCVNSIAQAQSYIWDQKAKQRGEDQPLKRNDHCPDMWRAAILGSRQVKKSIVPGVG
ncbi:MAG: phage terminase large subunit [Methanobrevibacter sp.]|nr:terminase family protein [Methanobrevibacter sp.]MEA4957555.1 phage terminase large subunit [Methanobrevibacter sp.]